MIEENLGERVEARGLEEATSHVADKTRISGCGVRYLGCLWGDCQAYVQAE